ncbi:uncharacterized protein LOC135502089 isoform X2 [Lineus longissimus]|uniref:uncharacterized protein LOC135502089 isoform X2 n=1 Tax=Lineus longissimus TaxID=88925 RepID=UPI00315DAE47
MGRLLPLFVLLLFKFVGSKDIVVVYFAGSGATSGTVRVRVNGSPVGSGLSMMICWDSSWGIEEANVTCRQMGFLNATSTGKDSDVIPPIIFDVRCSGTETNLADCSYSLSGSYQSNLPVSVICLRNPETQQPFDIRLAGGNTSAGGVELLKYGKWGVICDRDGEWKLASARVVCRQLGSVDAIRVTEPAEFGQGNGSIHLKNPGCKGDEWSIERCPIPYGWGGGVKACQTKDTAGVVCSPDKFPAYGISSTLYTPNASKSFGRFFLHSQGFPQLFNYEAQTHHLCTMTSNTIIELSIYIHYKRFKENHSETLSLQGIDTQTTSSTFYNLQLYGDDSNPGPYTTNTKSMTMEFKSNGAAGSGKFRLEIRVPASIAVSLNCYNLTTTPTTTSSTSTTSTTSTTSVTSQGNPTDTTTALVSNTATGGSTKGEVTEPITTPVSMTTDQTDSTTSASVDGVVGGLVGAILVVAIALILGVALWKLGLVRFGKRRNLRPANDTGGYDDKRVEFSGIENDSAYANVGTEYVNDAFILDGSSPMTDQDATSPYANVREFGQDESGVNQSHLQDPVPEAPYDDVRSVGPNNTTESAAESGSNQAHGGPRETQSLSNDDPPHSEESPYAHLDPVNHQEYLDFRELSPEQLRPI